MATERQLVQFASKDFDNLRELAKRVETKPIIKPFLDLSTTIKEATGMLPANVRPKLHELFDLHSAINMTIKDGLSTTCATATKFITKCSAVMKRGMSTKDEESLEKLANTFTGNYIVELKTFIEKARTDLNAIQKTLMLESSGGQLEELLKEFTELERQLLENAKVKTDRALEKSKNQGQIESLKHEIQICERAIENYEEAQKEMRQKLDELNKKIPDYEKELLKHRDSSSQERTSILSTFLWKVRDVNADNGERIARENLLRLIESKKDLEMKLNNWSAKEFEKRLEVAKVKLNDVVQVQDTLNSDFTKSEDRYARIEQRFKTVQKEIEVIYERSENHNQQSIMLVDTLSNGIIDACNCLMTAFAAIQTHLKRIDADADLLVASMIAAFHLIIIADECNGTNTIDDIRGELCMLNT
ncbi:unnamed protein product [Adineta steineri]|uniref:Uncharacterized protein n=1 Tax=Adineta steineri TaxID=433720 RepID=A0A814FR29_9BILA|nr:unnamed protein product [Adineta steineri]CAF4066102.1 unnamed protein product [Adineta steineri]